MMKMRHLLDVCYHFKSILRLCEFYPTTEGVRELRLASAELAEHFSDGLALDASSQQLVQLRAACRDLEALLALLTHLQGRDETVLLEANANMIE